MQKSNTTSGFGTQAEKIENLLRSRYGQWVAAFELADVALQYCARINAIRKKLRAAGREEIQNKTEHVRGQVHGSYRICAKDSEPFRTDSRHDRAAQFEREFDVHLPAPVAATSDLPLFAESSL